MPFADRVLATWYARRPTPLALALAPLAGVYAAAVAARDAALYRRGVLRVRARARAGRRRRQPHRGRLGQDAARDRARRGARVARLAPGIREPRLRAPRGATRARERERRSRPRRRRAAAARRRPAAPWPSGAAVPRRRACCSTRDPACDVVVADDGLQHYALARDVEIVGDRRRARGFGNGWMLPGGTAARAARAARRRRCGRAAGATRMPGGVTGDARDTLMAHEPVRWRNLAEPASTADPATFRPARRVGDRRHRESGAVLRAGSRARHRRAHARVSRSPPLRRGAISRCPARRRS